MMILILIAKTPTLIMIDKMSWGEKKNVLDCSQEGEPGP